MRITFQQGIISSQTEPFLSINASGNINLLASNKALTVTVAHKTANYLHSEDDTVVDAWTGTFLSTQSYYLYLEFDTKTFKRTFGYTTEAPKNQATEPTAPTLQTTWYNTDTNRQYKWLGTSYAPVLRVFIAKLNNSKFTSLSDRSPAFYGTQIGSNKSVFAGRIMYTEFGKPIIRDSGTFVTTEDQFFTNQSQVIGVRLESNITTAKASESLAAYQIVALDINGTISTAAYSDVGNAVVAVLTEDLLVNEVGNLVIQGTVTNPSWDFSSLSAGTKLYVNNGELTSNDPYRVNPVKYSTAQVPVAKVLSSDSVIFEQGLGGVGPVGPAGKINSIPAATTTTVGGVVLSTDPSSATSPVVVTTNDPRLSGAPFAAGNHTHSADQVSVSTNGDVTASTVQAALEELDSRKANKTPVYYDVNFFRDGLVASVENAVIHRTIIPRDMQIEANAFTLSRVLIAPNATTTFYVYINGSQSEISITFNPSSNEGLVSTSDSTGSTSYTLKAGDYIDIVAPDTAENNISDIAGVFVATVSTDSVTSSRDDFDFDIDFDEDGDLPPLGGGLGDHRTITFDPAVL